MTTVLFYKDRVYADSTVMKGSERLDCLTKIKAFEIPFRIFSERQDYVVDDVVYGYSGTGSQPAMEGLIDCLRTDMDGQGNIHGAIGHFNMAYVGGLLVHGNVFEAVLIGEKGNHSFRFDGAGFCYVFYPRGDKVLGLGTGGEMAVKHVQHHGDGMRAMLQAFATDEMSGGWVDVWEMAIVEHEVDGVKTDRWSFRRIGLREPIPKDLILHVLDMHWPKPGTDKVPMQFKRSAKMRDEVIKVRLENTLLHDQIVQLEEDRAATAVIHQNAIEKLKKQIARLKKEAKPITVKQLKLPKADAPADAAVVTTRRRRAPKAVGGDMMNFR
ncbi:hypothetical protein [Burkholderia phage FLC9]|nr:hypothetical protein [Burkholderia phage FLC9]